MYTIAYVSTGALQELDAGSKGVTEDSLRKKLFIRYGHGLGKQISNGKAPGSNKRANGENSLNQPELEL